jgi:hypothetical protein
MLHGAVPNFRPAAPHGPLREVRDNTFVVTGAMKVGPFQMTRNMTVVRRGSELTLLNSVRLGDDGEKELAKLGTVKTVVRLGWFHGIDDPYYEARYQPRFLAGKRVVPVNVKNSEELVDGKVEDFGTTFVFKGGNYDEGCVLVDDLIVTCDSIQNQADTEGFNFGGKLMARMFGLHGGVIVAGTWLKRMGGAARVRSDFARLTSLPFHHLVSGHGAPLVDGTAKAKVAQAIAKGAG